MGEIISCPHRGVEAKSLDVEHAQSTYKGLNHWLEHSAKAAIVLRPCFGAVAMEMFEFCLYGYAAEQIKESFFMGSAAGTWYALIVNGISYGSPLLGTH